MLKKMTAALMSLALIATASDCSGSAEVTVNADTKEDAKKLVDSFYADLPSADPVEMTTTLNGEAASVFTKDGTKMKVEDKMNSTLFYLMEENGKKYYLSAEGVPSEEEYTYDLYAETINTALNFMVTAYFQDGISEEDGLKYSATQTEVEENGKTNAELKITITAEQDGETAEISSTGTKENGKVTKIVAAMKSKDQSVEYQYDFKYDGISVELPEYEIVDRSQYFHHVDSPYATYADAVKDAGEDGLSYVTIENTAYAIIQKDGKYYQLAAEIPEDVMTAYDKLDVNADDYSEQVNALLDPLTITDCVDFSELVLTAEEMESMKGKTVGYLIEEGYEGNGWSIWDEGATVYAAKNDIVYEANITLPEGFDSEADFEFEDLSEAVINDIAFFDVNTSMLPME